MAKFWLIYERIMNDDRALWEIDKKCLDFLFLA